MARLATIDLDWLEEETQKDHYDYRFRGGLDWVRQHCTPIEEPKAKFVYDPDYLPKTCLNNWESNKYCSNENKCELCKSK